MKYKYQVVIHQPYYPSSSLFETYEQAFEYFLAAKGCYGEDNLVTLCEIKGFKGSLDDYSEIIEW